MPQRNKRQGLAVRLRGIFRSFRLMSRDHLRPIRYLWRAPLLVIHVFVGLPLALIAIAPPLCYVPIAGEHLDTYMIRWWSGWMMRCFGFRIRSFGKPLPGPVMYVANHLSWLDIELMHSRRAMHFVAKSEIADWPVVGWLSSRAGTIFHRRGNTDSLNSVMAVVVERLREGHPVGIFPEGGTGRGEVLRTFHARIFQAALDAGVPVQPVALLYGRNGKQDLSVPFGPDESFFANLIRLLGHRSMDAEVHFLEPVTAAPDARRRMAEESRSRIGTALGMKEFADARQ